MLTSKQRMGLKDKPVADLAIRTVEQCRAAEAPVLAMLPPDVNEKLKAVQRKQDALIAELYAGKITFGEFNVTIAYIDEDRASILSTVPQLTQTPPPPPASAQSNAITKPVELPPKKQPAQNAKPQIIGPNEIRIALIIGNGNYSNLPKLSNPANDAKSIADSLKQIGFQTALALDASEQTLRRELRKFANESTKASIAVVFYAGHRAQVNGDNYLLPVDMEIAHTEADIQLTGLKVDDLVNSVRSNTKIVFLDACRDNPALYKNLVQGRSARAVGLAPPVASNLDQVKAGGGVFIAYATESGSIAEDGQGKHSPFTQALLRNLQKPISIDDMFSFVTKEVRLTTKNKQRPYKYASLESIVCLTGNCLGASSDSIIATDPIQQTQHSEAEDLQIALKSKNADALETYLQKYPDSWKRAELSASIFNSTAISV
jgi:Caspase domain